MSKSIYKSLVSGLIGLREEEIVRWITSMCAYVGECIKLKNYSYNTRCQKTNRYEKSHTDVFLTKLYFISYCILLFHIHTLNLRLVAILIQSLLYTFPIFIMYVL